MRRLLIVAVLISWVNLTGQSALAQYGVDYWTGPPGVYSWSYGATTFAESYAYGVADVIRARGQANYLDSEALVNLEEARRRYIQNRLDWTNTYFDMRRANEIYRDSQRRPRATKEQLIRYARQGMPERSSGTQIDSVTGEIAWPIVLRAPEFSDHRKILDREYRKRAAHGSILDRDSYLVVESATVAMLDVLREHVRELPANRYLNGRKFIGMLKHESNFPPN